MQEAANQYFSLKKKSVKNLPLGEDLKKCGKRILELFLSIYKLKSES